MNKYYFTFGSAEYFPFPNRYLIVMADNIYTAVAKFREKYPDRTPNTINCAFVYLETEWDSVLPSMRQQEPAEVLM